MNEMNNSNFHLVRMGPQ